jgi:hypothetical protein
MSGSTADESPAVRLELEGKEQNGFSQKPALQYSGWLAKADCFPGVPPAEAGGTSFLNHSR